MMKSSFHPARVVFLLWSVLLAAPRAQGQDWHVILLKDKGDTSLVERHPAIQLTQRAIDRRMRQGITWHYRDYPVNPEYITEVASLSLSIRYSSKWLNALLVQANTSQLDQLKSLPYVKGVADRLGELRVQQLQNSPPTLPLRTSAHIDYGSSWDQIRLLGLHQMHELGYYGQGVQIAVMDAGFPGLSSPFFDSLRLQDRILGGIDLVENDLDPFHANDHGTKVLSIMGAYQQGEFVGGSHRASFWLMRTEDVISETPIEEFLWLIAAEKADSLGVDIIHVSLGYTAFDSPQDSYTVADLDGNTALITRAADWAAATGMLVVTSSGNDAASSWGHITMPGDADSILTVGGTNYLGQHTPASSYGLTTDGRQKPEVVAMGSSTAMVNGSNRVIRTGGTSYAAPMVSSMAAGLWEAYPNLTNMQIRQAIIESASLADSPDPRIGYGVPNLLKAYFALSPTSLRPSDAQNPIIAHYHDQVLTVVSPETLIGLRADVVVWDMAGKLVMEENVSQMADSHSWPLPLSKGVYLIKLYNSRRQYIGKFVVK